MASMHHPFWGHRCINTAILTVHHPRIIWFYGERGSLVCRPHMGSCGKDNGGVVNRTDEDATLICVCGSRCWIGKEVADDGLAWVNFWHENNGTSKKTVIVSRELYSSKRETDLDESRNLINGIVVRMSNYGMDQCAIHWGQALDVLNQLASEKEEESWNLQDMLLKMLAPVEPSSASMLVPLVLMET